MSLRDQINEAIASSVNSIIRRLQAVEEKAVPLPIIVVGKTAAGGVPAIAGDTPGKATDIVEYKFNSSDELVATGRTLTGYNLATTAVVGTTWVHLKEEHLTGRLLVDFEDCG